MPNFTVKEFENVATPWCWLHFDKIKGEIFRFVIFKTKNRTKDCVRHCSHQSLQDSIAWNVWFCSCFSKSFWLKLMLVVKKCCKNKQTKKKHSNNFILTIPVFYFYFWVWGLVCEKWGTLTTTWRNVHNARFYFAQVALFMSVSLSFCKQLIMAYFYKRTSHQYTHLQSLTYLWYYSCHVRWSISYVFC